MEVREREREELEHVKCGWKEQRAVAREREICGIIIVLMTWNGSSLYFFSLALQLAIFSCVLFQYRISILFSANTFSPTLPARAFGFFSLNAKVGRSFFSSLYSFWTGIYTYFHFYLHFTPPISVYVSVSHSLCMDSKCITFYRCTTKMGKKDTHSLSLSLGERNVDKSTEKYINFFVEKRRKWQQRNEKKRINVSLDSWLCIRIYYICTV